MSTFNRFATPRAYVDLISYLLSTGWRDLSNFSLRQDGSDTINIVNGVEANLYDMRPHDYLELNLNNQAFYIQIDLGATNTAITESSFLAILNHNFEESESVFKVEVDADSAFGSSTVITNSSNHDAFGVNDRQWSVDDNFIHPEFNGWSLITFGKVTSDSRYLRVTIQDSSGASANFGGNPIIGGLMFGEYIDFPVSPELGIKTSYAYDNTVLSSSTGGNTFANSTNFGSPTWSASLPFVNTAGAGQEGYYFEKRHGRQKHSMNFSYISDTDLFTTNQFASVNDNATHFYDAETLHSNFYNRILGQHQPFLFSIDSTSTSEGDYGMYRMAKDSFTATQVANRTYNIGLDLVETW